MFGNNAKVLLTRSPLDFLRRHDESCVFRVIVYILVVRVRRIRHCVEVFEELLVCWVEWNGRVLRGVGSHDGAGNVES